MSVRIHRADPDDYYDDILELHRQVLPGDKPVEDAPEVMWWVAEDDNVLAGFAAMRPSRQYTKGGFLCMAGVHPLYRGHGLQKRLIRARIRRARELGWDFLTTYTIPANPASINSLIACGFRALTPKIKWVGSDVNYWCLEL